MSGTTSPLEQRGSTTAIPEELTLDYAEITSIPPLPLWTLLAADKETPTKAAADDQQVCKVPQLLLLIHHELCGVP